jgi:hypothetical protein
MNMHRVLVLLLLVSVGCSDSKTKAAESDKKGPGAGSSLPAPDVVRIAAELEDLAREQGLVWKFSARGSAKDVLLISNMVAPGVDGPMSMCNESILRIWAGPKDIDDTKRRQAAERQQELLRVFRRVECEVDAIVVGVSLPIDARAAARQSEAVELAGKLGDLHVGLDPEDTTVLVFEAPGECDQKRADKLSKLITHRDLGWTAVVCKSSAGTFRSKFEK